MLFGTVDTKNWLYFFSSVLNESGSVGQTEEWFGPQQISAYCELFDIKKEDFYFYRYLTFIISRSSRNGWFCCNAHVNHIMYWRERGIDLMNLKWNHIVYVKRNDKFGQATSLARAVHTRAWRSYDRAIAPDSSTPANVLERLLWLYKLEQFYSVELKSYVVREFEYEEFAFRNFQDTFAQIEELLGIPISAVRPKTVQQQVTSDENQDVKIFLNWLGNIA